MESKLQIEDYQIVFEQASCSTRGSTKKHSRAKGMKEMERRSTLYQVDSPGANLFSSKLPLFTSFPHRPLCLPFTLLVLCILPQRSTILSRIYIPIKSTSSLSLAISPSNNPPGNSNKASSNSIPLLEPLSQLFLRVLDGNLTARIAPNPVQGGTNQRLQCGTGDAPGYDTNNYRGLKHKVQDQIDNGTIAVTPQIT